MINSVLVMGSDSSIGSQLVEELKNSFRVIGLARRATTKTSVTTYQYDLATLDADSFPAITADACIMFSSITDIGVCEEKPLDALEVNVVGMMKAIRFLKALNIRQFIYFSTGTVCSGTDLPMREDCIPEPPNLYSLTKSLAEQIAKYYSTNLQTLVIRPFFVYGPGTRKERLIFNLINEIAAGKNIKLHKDFKPLVNPIFIGDAVKVVRLILEKGLPSNFQCLNLAGKDVVSIKDLALIISDALGRGVNFVQMDSERTNTTADITKLQELYKYEFRYPIRAGIEETVRWMTAQGLIQTS